VKVRRDRVAHMKGYLDEHDELEVAVDRRGIHLTGFPAPMSFTTMAYWASSLRDWSEGILSVPIQDAAPAIAPSRIAKEDMPHWAR